MKRTILCLFFTLLFSGLFAQNQGIAFTDLSWNEAVDKAKSEHKLIFIDCYTVWCGPCKQMLNEVFTREDVAAYFNEHFINIKNNIEKKGSVGITIEVKYLPTLVFYDPVSEQIVHRAVGSVPAEKLIEAAKIAIEGTNSIQQFQARYTAGEREPRFILNYANVLNEAGMKRERFMVICDFLDHIQLADLCIPEVWDFYVNTVNSATQPSIEIAWNNKEKFYAFSSKEAVDAYFDNVFNQTVNGLTYWTSDNLKTDKATFLRVLHFLETTDWKGKDMAVKLMEDDLMTYDKNFPQIMKNIKTMIKSKAWNETQKYEYTKLFLGKMAMCDNQKLVQQAISLLNNYAKSQSALHKSQLYYLKKTLYAAIGDKEGARNANEEGYQWQVKAEKK